MTPLHLPRIAARELLRESAARAVIFDMDGVLADTAEFHIEAWALLARAHGLYPPEEAPGTREDSPATRLIRSTFGQTNDTIIPLLWSHAGKPLPRAVGELSREKESYYREAAGGRVEPLPGLERFLRWLERERLPAAVGTSGPLENIEFLLDEFGWRQFFRVLVDRSRFAAGKPAPDCFLAAAALLSVHPRRTIVFEDSIHGLVAARRGGFLPAAVETTSSATELRLHARWLIRDFRDISC